MSIISSNSSPISIIPAGQGHICEQFIGDGQKDVFDLREIPSSVPAMTASVSRSLHPMRIPLVIGDIYLNTFTEGYYALVDAPCKRIFLKQVLPKGELLIVEYDFDDSKQSPSASYDLDPQTEPWNIPGWEPWDYQNWRDFQAAMREDKPIEYAMCVWLMQQESNDLAFQGGEWSEWYHYARAHCLCFDREQPRRR